MTDFAVLSNKYFTVLQHGITDITVIADVVSMQRCNGDVAALEY